MRGKGVNWSDLVGVNDLGEECVLNHPEDIVGFDSFRGSFSDLSDE
jgi:hypothetical protein